MKMPATAGFYYELLSTHHNLANTCSFLVLLFAICWPEVDVFRVSENTRSITFLLTCRALEPPISPPGFRGSTI